MNNFTKWLALKTFTIDEVSNATPIVIFFDFLHEIYFPLGYFFKCNLKNP